MNIFVLLGILVGFGGIITGYLIDGGALASLVRPSSAAIVFGGTFGYALLSYPMSHMKKIPRCLKRVIFSKHYDYTGIVETIYNLATIARKEGILALEAEAEKTDDPFIKKGLNYIADVVEPEFLENILDSEIEGRVREYEEAAGVLEGMGGCAPTMGVLGTVMGMVSILRNMGGDMAELGAEIATAFIATFYGVGSANMLWLPMASHIKKLAEEEVAFFTVVKDGLLAIQAGEYPARIKASLISQIGDKYVQAKPEEQKSAEN